MANSSSSDACVAILLDVKALAELLNCSERHVYRLADRGRIPAPVKLGTLVRWPRSTIYEWLQAGCPACAKEGDRR